jgi:hypothetical protein
MSALPNPFQNAKTQSAEVVIGFFFPRQRDKSFVTKASPPFAMGQSASRRPTIL